ncbi:MAG: prepilin-type N-terminal cleavage/methylation domain-containing protein [Patescibacteria group bacterium]|nr:prepilin-type N-terminal cleavage/methylation domain-containing protein [Patescibacteria group bacterium]MDW8279635.1 prepilin-type N-terminal cleavage/methylation domain-containing protein [bacterium]
MKNIIIKNNGFTLIELLVAISSFIVIISIAIGGFSSALKSQRQAIFLMNMNNNISLVLEQMSREIRTGFNFISQCQNYPCYSNQLSFTNAYGQNVVYKFSNNNIERQIGANQSKQIIANNISVQYLRFYIDGILQGDNKQPKITILIGISPKDKTTSNIISNIQTTISSRVLDS